MRFPFSGVLVVDKPVGVSSRHVVNRVAKTLSMRTVGHAGTLDPIASGVVVVCVGHATKLIDFLHTRPKRYAGHFLLGRSSASDDTETPVELEVSPRRPSQHEVEETLDAFRGPIMQRPCTFSAVHIEGRRAYDLARKGQPVEIAARPVTIHRLEIVEYVWPRIILNVECSTGTYIRGLGRDLAVRLGTKAIMDGLTRLSVGPFDQRSAVPLEHLESPNGVDVLKAALLPARAAVAHLPVVSLTAQQLDEVAHGRILRLPQVSLREAGESVIAAVDDTGALVGILRPHPAGWRMRPNFVGRS